MPEQGYKQAMAGLEFSLSVAFRGEVLPIRYYLLNGAARQCLVSARLTAGLVWREMNDDRPVESIAIRRGERIIDVFDGNSWSSEQRDHLLDESAA